MPPGGICKDLDDHPPVDTHLGRGGRFREILRLLESARHDIEHEEDNPIAREWRSRAFRNIDDAIAMIRKAVTTNSATKG